MDNVALPPSSLTQSLAGLAAPKTPEQKADTKVERVTDAHKTELPLEKSPEKARLEAVKRASETLAANPYPVSDVRFTIYQERVEGGILFVTRFTSLKDGKVTLVQEPALLAQAGRDMGTVLTTSV